MTKLKKKKFKIISIKIMKKPFKGFKDIVNKEIK